MREPSGRDTRGLRARGCFFAFLLLAPLFWVAGGTAHAQAITRFVRDTGRINFVTTGGSLRSSDSSTCAVNATSTQALTGIPVGTTVRNAYLYWGGSGSSADTSVTLNGSTVTATRTFARTFNNGTAFPFFGGFADVTNLVSGNGSFTFGNLTVNVGAPHCGSSAVVAGWALIVVYESPTEPLRAINLFDGLDYFYDSQLTLTPDGFRVPSANVDGRVAVFTLEGDPGNSDPLPGGLGNTESLRYNGNLLDDGLTPAGSVPAVQQFDGTINTQGVVNSYGIDVDQYDISPFLTPGQTTGTTQYSSGRDLVLLMAQIVSATSDPAVDLTVTKTHSGTFVAGGTGTYTITVSNAAGMEREDNTVTVTDTLPAGLTYNSFSGTGWSCSNAAQVVTCTHGPTLDAGQSFPPLSLVVNVLEAAAASVTNTVSVSTPSYELVTSNNSASDVTATLDPNLSTSTKTVLDVNGGEASPGDTLRYTVTLTESAGGQAVNVSLTDNIPDNTTFGGFVSVPAGATSNFAAPPAGANGNGLITVSGITVPASGSVTLVFDVIVNAGTLPGETVANTATITNPNGADATPAAPTLTVNPSLIPATGTKFLYLRRDAGGALSLSRNVPTAADTNEVVVNGAPDSWTITPALQTAFSISANNIPVRLWLRRSSNNPGNRNVTVTLTASNGFSTSVTNSIAPPNSATPSLFSFTLPNAAVRNFPAGTTFTLTVAQNGSNTVTVFPNGNGVAGNNSRIEFPATTVINVDSVTTWNAAYNGGSTQGTFYPGQTVFIRAQVSDPFGSFDIRQARITIIDPSNVTQVNDQLMAAQGAPATCNSTSAASCVFQYSYAVPASPSLGGWTIRVTADEGAENMVTDLGVGNFTVVIPQPALTILKTSTVLSDPVNNGVNPRRIPNAVVRYDITVTNSGPGTVDAGSLTLTDPIPADAAMYVSTTSGNPVVFVDSGSGLTYSYATHVTYSSSGPSGPWNYTPVPDANGFDPAVRAVRIAPAGVMSAAGVGNPAFTIQFRVRVN
jgi:trimeric autotransporter adhesin